MAEFIREVVGGPVHVIAESAGGAAGCWLAILEPGARPSLILVAPTAFAGLASRHRQLRPRPWSFACSVRARPGASRPPTPTVPRASATRRRMPPGCVRRLRNADLLERLGEIVAPTLVLWGTADEILSPEAGQVFVQRIPVSYRILIYGAAHALPVAACRQFVSFATDFVERGERFVVAERA